eukprot:COSAG05_NODE_711_length_7822_cov_11.919720_1_plen_133_part_10
MTYASDVAQGGVAGCSQVAVPTERKTAAAVAAAARANLRRATTHLSSVDAELAFGQVIRGRGGRTLRFEEFEAALQILAGKVAGATSTRHHKRSQVRRVSVCNYSLCVAVLNCIPHCRRQGGGGGGGGGGIAI